VAAESVYSVLSAGQLQKLRRHGEERTAEVGERLFSVGDRSYPFIAILEGEAAIEDVSGNEIVRHGPSGFLGEMNLLSGQTVYLNAIVTEPMRYIAVERDELRRLLFEDGSLADQLLGAFINRREALQKADGVGVEVVGPRSSEPTRRILDYARRNRFPYQWLDPLNDPGAAELIDGVDPARLPLVRIPGGATLEAPSNGELSRALGVGLELGSTEEVDLLVVGGGPAGLGAAVYWSSRGRRSAGRPARRAGSRTTSASRAGSAAPS
jgi:thioredoxin reductase (NADPH)